MSDSHFHSSTSNRNIDKRITNYAARQHIKVLICTGKKVYLDGAVAYTNQIDNRQFTEQALRCVRRRQTTRTNTHRLQSKYHQYYRRHDMVATRQVKSGRRARQTLSPLLAGSNLWCDQSAARFATSSLCPSASTGEPSPG